MKKMIVTLAVAMSTLVAFAGDENVNAKVLDAFKTEFTNATEVEWTVGSNHYMAAFTYNSKHVFAYYTMDGELLGLSRYISPSDLPIGLHTNLKKHYSGYWISDLFEVAKYGETGYYITVEDADTKIVLKSSGTDWSIFKKIKKA